MNYRTLVPLLHSYAYFCSGIITFNDPCCDSVIIFGEKSNFLQGKEFVAASPAPSGEPQLSPRSVPLPFPVHNALYPVPLPQHLH